MPCSKQKGLFSLANPHTSRGRLGPPPQLWDDYQLTRSTLDLETSGGVGERPCPRCWGAPFAFGCVVCFWIQAFLHYRGSCDESKLHLESNLDALQCPSLQRTPLGKDSAKNHRAWLPTAATGASCWGITHHIPNLELPEV